MTQPNTDAVVQIEYVDGNNLVRGSGVLLAGGKYILTAAHLFNAGPSAASLNISSSAGALSGANAIHLYPAWSKNDSNFNHDIALIELKNPVTSVQGAELIGSGNLIGETFTFAGFGPASGLHTGTNTIDADAASLNSLFSRNVLPGAQFVYDHDNGSEAQNTLGTLIGAGSAVPTVNESQAVAGDSGGPLFINGKVAGISSYAYRNPQYDVNGVIDFSAGEVGLATNVQSYSGWINGMIGDVVQPQVPSQGSEVVTTVQEPIKDSVTNYFLLEIKAVSSVDISFDVKTKDGSATAGSDYKAVSTRMVLPAGEKTLVIPVEILGDSLNEGDETFSLVLSNFAGEGVDNALELTATHTISNYDLFGIS